MIHTRKQRAKHGEALSFYKTVVLNYEGDECLFWPFARTKGGYANLSGEYVHRKVCEEVRGPAPTPDHEAAHSCGAGKYGCVARRHLDWKTHAQNEADKFVHGTRLMRRPYIPRPRRNMHGASNPNAKLSVLQVAEIRALSPTMRQIDIAKRFGVSKQTISLLLKGGSWSLC